MPFEWLDHTSDIGVRGIGHTIEEAFTEAARGMFAMMVDLSTVRGRKRLEVGCQARSRQSLLVAWLAELLAQKDLTYSFFSSFTAEITICEDGWRLSGWCDGEEIDPARHRLGTEVKGITASGLRVEQVNGRWIAECIVDV
ncbi:archease [Candidatus Bipolaricaulota bacterium]|nr:archease [Candidatus Bipolaricaulota bacterium]